MSLLASAINVAAAVIVLWLLEIYGHKVDWQQWIAMGVWWIFCNFTHSLLDRKNIQQKQ